jgi:long-chain acyl-CoA synthetase
VAVKGDMNMKEYYRKKELTEQVMNKDRLIVNDIVYFDEEGYYYFVSRVGDIINVQGHKVTPSGIEKVAMNYEGIADCACVAKDDVRYGQIPVLFVQYEEENNDTECESGGKTKDSTKEERLIEFLKNNLESYRVPKEIISIKKIPRTDTGKLMRKSLSMLTLK